MQNKKRAHLRFGKRAADTEEIENDSSSTLDMEKRKSAYMR